MRILANTGGEHQCVYAADGSGQSADFAAHAKGEVIQSGFGGCGPGGFNGAHLVAQAGEVGRQDGGCNAVLYEGL